MRSFPTILAILLTLFLLGFGLHAAEYNVNQDGTGDFTVIQEAIDAAVDGDTITVHPGTYYENINFRGKNIILTSLDPEDQDIVDTTIIDGGAAGSVVTFDGTENETCELLGFTITNGNTTGGYGGGGIHCESSPTISFCTVTGNTAEYNGGGIYCLEQSDPILTVLTDCTFSDNTARLGGGINYSAETSLTLIDCTVSGNTAQDKGGGIWHSGDSWGSKSWTMTNCTVSGNSAGSGGGIYCNYCGLDDTTSCIISDNTAVYQGGGICTNSGQLYGGGWLRLTDCTISGNSADSGGGTYSRSWQRLTNCTISDNTADGSGGGVYCYGDTPQLTKCTISGNAAHGSGGGIYCSYLTEYQSFELTDCTIDDNTAYDSGGGMYFADFAYHGTASATLTNCGISNNTAANGGGFYCSDCNDPTLANCTVSGNTAHDSGGGIYCDDDHLTLNICTISGNTSGAGGGMSCKNDSSAALANCTIADNIVSQIDSGGGIYCGTDCTVTVTDSILWGDIASGATNEIREVASGAVTVTYSDVEGGWTGEGNIDNNPCFVSGPDGDYYLSQIAAGAATQSTCVDAGSDTAANLGIDHLTTRADQVKDTGIADMGHHYPWVNKDPVLSDGAVDPAFGTVDTTFAFSVHYQDEDGHEPQVKDLYIDGDAHNMSVDSGDSDDGVYVYQTILTKGSHSYHFHFDDGYGGSVRDPETGEYDGPGVNREPELSNGLVDPTSGRTDTAFEYSVEYYDADGHSPTIKRVWIDGVRRDMALHSGAAADGIYTCEKTGLSTGAHSFYFEYGDGYSTTRLPPSGTYDGPAVGENYAPVLSEAKVEPDPGSESDTFTYSVDYYDQDGDAPAVRKVFLDSDSGHYMSLGSGDPDDGTYRYQTDLQGGDHTFYFLFEDGHGGSDREPPAGEQDGPWVNHIPVLTDGSVDPASGSNFTMFTFSVHYSDEEGHPPAVNQVHIEGVDGSPFEMSGSGASSIYTLRRTLPAGEHRFWFYFEDTYGGYARLPVSGAFDGPSIEQNEAPVLSECQVSPTSGTTDTEFTYSVLYYDTNGHEPTVKQICIDGSAHSMSGSGSDSAYTYSTELSPGDHNFYFYFEDGHDAFDREPSTGTNSGPYVNYSPTLYYGEVAPVSGTTETSFTFSVHYNDLDGDPPSIKMIHIDGDSGREMTLESGDPANGTYSFETALPGGGHNFDFHFEDGNGGSTRDPMAGTHTGPSVTWAGGNFYVDAENGDNASGDGSQADPWKTITFALENTNGSEAAPVVIHVAPGTYDTTMVGGDAETFPLTFDSYDSIIGDMAWMTIVNADSSDRVIYCDDVTGATIEGLTITGGAEKNGAGVCCVSSSPTLSHCVITGNSASGSGGGVLAVSSSPIIANTLIYDNNAAIYGGGIHCSGSSPTLVNCAISDNSASKGGGINCYSNSSPTVINSVLWGDTPSELGFQSSGGISIRYSCIQGGRTGEGNIDEDPLFASSSEGDYRLLTDSPCIDVGENSAVVGTTDLDGNGRILFGSVDMGAYEFQETDSSTELEMDTPYEGVLEPLECEHFSIEVSGGLPLLIQVVPLEGIEVLTFYGGFDASGSDRDMARNPNPRGVYEMVISPTQGGRYSFSVCGTNVDEAGGRYTIAASAVDRYLSDISPRTAGDVGDVGLSLTGLGFKDGMRVELQGAAGSTLEAEHLIVLSPTRTHAQFNLLGASPGVYDVVATWSGGHEEVLSGALEIVPNGSGAELRAEISSPAFVRSGRDYTLLLEYENTGDADMLAPLFVVRSKYGRSLLRLSDEDEFQPDEIQILGISFDTPAGILRPGMKCRIPIQFHVPAETGNRAKLEFELEVLSEQDTSIDWDEEESRVRPPGAEDESWPFIWANLKAQMGDTWEEYAAALAENATHLSLLGRFVYDVRDLFQSEMLQAVGLTPRGNLSSSIDAFCPTPGVSLAFGRTYPNGLEARFRTGPLGRGWTHSHDIYLEEQWDGDVILHGPMGVRRSFEQTADGGFEAQPDDYGTLTIDSGAYILTEKYGTAYSFNPDLKLDYIRDTNGNRVTASYDSSQRLTSLPLRCPTHI